MAYHHRMLAPEQIRLVHSVFNVVIREEWFPRTQDNCGECAKLIIQLYQGGVDDGALMEEAKAAARKRFSGTVH